MNPTALKKKLIKNGGAAAQKVWRLQQPVYVCPLCMNAIPDSEQLTLEHVPQKSLGGKILCLTCRSCNSDAVHKYEGMMKYEPQNKHLIGRLPIRGSLGQLESMLNGMWSIGSDGLFDFKVIAKMNDPRRLPAAEKAHKEICVGSSLQASWQMKYDQKKVNVGHLKNAYLAAYAKFGYEMIKERAYDIVRRQLSAPDEQMISRYRLYCTNTHPLKRGIFLTRSPIRTLICKWDNSAIFLPAPDDLQADIYRWIDDNVNLEGALNFIVEEGFEWPAKPNALSS